jgi:hypothetical protein
MRRWGSRRILIAGLSSWLLAAALAAPSQGQGTARPWVALDEGSAFAPGDQDNPSMLALDLRSVRQAGSSASAVLVTVSAEMPAGGYARVIDEVRANCEEVTLVRVRRRFVSADGAVLRTLHIRGEDALQDAWGDVANQDDIADTVCFGFDVLEGPGLIDPANAWPFESLRFVSPAEVRRYLQEDDAVIERVDAAEAAYAAQPAWRDFWAKRAPVDKPATAEGIE